VGTDCPGGKVIIVREEFWRANNTTDKISGCPYSPKNCLGGNTNIVNETCSLGHIGAYCEVCDIDGIHWN
jgi:hypothetical protein